MIQLLMTQGFKKCFGVDFNLQFSFELHLLIIKASQLKASLVHLRTGQHLARKRCGQCFTQSDKYSHMDNKAPIAMDGPSPGPPKVMASPSSHSPARHCVPGTGVQLAAPLGISNFGHLQKQSLVCAHVFLSKSEDYYSILKLSSRNWEGYWLLGRLMGLACFSLQFSQSQHLYFQCSPCLSHRCHAHL